ncbi:MAG: site-specific integrase [Paludibacteraceae bacterium]|nr:site-specific integrase [Paludibacteraceae bacterium]
MFEYSLNGVSLGLVRDTRYKDKEEACPLKWRVISKRKVFYYSSGINLLPNEWEYFETSKKPILKEYRNSLQRYFDEVIKKHIRELAEIDQFTFDALNVRLNKAVVNTVNSAFQIKIDELSAANRIGNASIYQGVKNAIEAFAGDKIPYSAITPRWLVKYQAYMEGKKITYATMGMRFRTLRAIINDAIRQNIIKQSVYPFGKGKFEIPTSGGREMALTLDDIRKIAEFDCQTETMRMCRDLWLFSFYCNGVNFGDMCRFKYSDIDQGEIYFYRKKTFNKTKDKKEIVAPLLPPMQTIIDLWGNDNTDKNVFVFPFCNGCTTEQQLKLAISNITRLTNKQIKLVTKALELPDISTYNARHSYATILAKMRVPESYIAEQLGHAHQTITQNYFGSYSKEERIKYNSMLLS